MQGAIQAAAVMQGWTSGTAQEDSGAPAAAVTSQVCIGLQQLLKAHVIARTCCTACLHGHKASCMALATHAHTLWPAGLSAGPEILDLQLHCLAGSFQVWLCSQSCQVHSPA